MYYNGFRGQSPSPNGGRWLYQYVSMYIRAHMCVCVFVCMSVPPLTTVHFCFVLITQYRRGQLTVRIIGHIIKEKYKSII
jgi:hypothetical protein